MRLASNGKIEITDHWIDELTALLTRRLSGDPESRKLSGLTHLLTRLYQLQTCKLRVYNNI